MARVGFNDRLRNTSAGLARPYMGSGTGFAAAPSPAAVGAGGGRGVVNPALVDPRAPTPQAKKAVAAVLQGKPVPTTRARVNAAPVVAPTQSDAEFLAAARAGAGRHVDGSQVQPLPQEPEYVPTSQIEQLRAISRISQMGPEGQFLANHLYNQQFGKDGGEYDVKDGFMFNKRTGEVKRIKSEDGEWFYSDGVKINRRTGETQMVKPDTKEAERVTSTANNLDDMNEAIGRLNTVLGDNSIITNAKGDLGNSVANKFGNVTGIANSTTIARTKINDAVGAATNSIISMARASGMSASQMNSDADLKRIDALAGEVRDNYGALDAATLRAKLVQLQDMVKRKRELLMQSRGAAPVSAPSPSAPSGGLLSGRF